MTANSYADDKTPDCRGNKPCSEVTVTTGDTFIEGDTNTVEVVNTNEVSNSATSSSGGNTLSVSENHPGSITLRNVASPGTPNSYPTSPCRIAVSGGLSIAGGAISGGGSVEDEECTLRETVRSFSDLGYPEMGLYLLCTQSVVINGRKEKNGEVKDGSPVVGTDECFRLIREFKGADTHDDALRSDLYRIQDELAVLRLEQQTLEDQFAKNQEVQAPARNNPARPVTQYVQQPFLDESKKAKLAALLSTNEKEGF